MPIIIAWENDEKTILSHTYSGRWTLEDFHKAIDENTEQIGSVSHTVDIVVDLSQNKWIPPGILTVAGRLVRMTPDNQEMTILAGADRFTQLMLKAAINIVPNAGEKFQYVPQIEDAYALLHQIHNTRVGDG